MFVLNLEKRLCYPLCRPSNEVHKIWDKYTWTPSKRERERERENISRISDMIVIRKKRKKNKKY